MHHYITVLLAIGSILIQSSDAACGPNEVYYECYACDGTCVQPVVNCTEWPCSTGWDASIECGCAHGFVRSAADGGACVNATSDACVAQREKAQTTVCGANQQFYPCGPCDGTCAQPIRFCLAGCRVDAGCGCVSGYVRDTANGGECVNRTTTTCVAQTNVTTIA